jgi:hypothetical protein
VTVRLTFSADERTGRSDVRGTFRRETDTVPEGVVSDKAVFFRDAVAGSPPLIADESGGAGSGYDRLWVDLDGDGTIAEKEFVPLEEGGFSALKIIKKLECFVNDDGHSHAATFSVRLYSWRALPDLHLTSHVMFEGEAVLAGRAVHLSLQDSDGDGCVRQFLAGREHESGAELLFGPKDGAVERFHLPVARKMGIAGVYYRVDIAFEGTADAPEAVVTFTPLSPVTETVEIDGDGVTSVGFVGEAAAFAAEPENNRMRLPEGPWWPLWARVRQDGIDYEGTVDYPRKRSPASVKAGEPEKLKIGGPLTQSVTIEGAWKAGRLSASLGLTTGIGKIIYIDCSKGRPDAPEWVVRRPGGEAIVTGSFEYG